MAEIHMAGGFIALVDDADLERVLRAGPWMRRHAGRTTYAQHHIFKGPMRTTEQLHQFILATRHIDHINGDGLDNQRHNLRPATHAQNNQNRGATGGTSDYKGVSWRTRDSHWVAQIGQRHPVRKTFYIGAFSDEEEAARAYDARATELFGGFARLNFPKDGER
jgi:hypothetical protein